MIRVSQALIGEDEFLALRPVFERAYYGHAEKVVDFERELAGFLGVAADDVICVANGTSALHLTLDSLGVGEGDEVIVPSLTFVASYQAISATGATPVSCDIHSDSYLIDVDDAAKRVTARTKAIMPVHYTGAVCDMAAVQALSDRHGLAVVEDAAHAFGTWHNGRRVGAVGNFSCFSFDSIKNITCAEGGAVVCRDAEVADRIRQKRFLGMNRKTGTRDTGGAGEWFYDVCTQGYRYHMSNLNAAIGLGQLKKAEQFIARRQEISKRYVQALRSIEAIRLLETDYACVAPHIFVIRIVDGRRDALMDFLRDRGVQTGINYIPNHLHAFYRTAEPLPRCEQALREMLTIPLHCALTDDDVGYVIESIVSFFEETND
jgi:perosamine synthetase